MKIFAESRDGMLFLKFEGQLDAVSTVDSEQKLIALLGSAPAESSRDQADGMRVVVDLSPLTYLSSAGLGVLLRLTQRVMESKGRIVFHSPQARVRQILDIAGLSMMLSLHSSEEDAVQHLRNDNEKGNDGE